MILIYLSLHVETISIQKTLTSQSSHILAATVVSAMRVAPVE